MAHGIHYWRYQRWCQGLESRARPARGNTEGVAGPRLHYRLPTLCPRPTDPVSLGQLWPTGHIYSLAPERRGSGRDEGKARERERERAREREREEGESARARESEREREREKET